MDEKELLQSLEAKDITINDLNAQLTELTDEMCKVRTSIQKLMEDVLAAFQGMHPIVFPKVDDHGKSEEIDNNED